MNIHSESVTRSHSGIRVLIADDHGLMRQGLRLQLEQYGGIEVVGEAADGREAVRMAREHKPDVILMDVGMPRLNGIDAAAQIGEHQPEIAVLFVTAHGDEEYVLRALTAGARGYLLKETAHLDLQRAIEAVAHGQAFFSPEVARLLANEFVVELQKRGLTNSYELLTSREKELFQLFAEGRTSKSVADLLNLSQHTVDTHRTRIQQKLDLHSASDLIRYAVKKKILP